ncbi:ADAM family mig-17, partial [Biomphalaria glabrata]
MFQYEASNDTGDQMPDQFNVTFSTETKFLTKFNLRRAQSFDVDIPLYTLDIDREGFFQSRKVKTRPRKDTGYYHDTNHKAVFCIKRSPETLSNRNVKFHLKAVFQMDNSEYLFDSDNKTHKKPWRNMSLETFYSPTRTESTTPRSRTTFDHYVYKLELLRRTSFDLFDTQIPPPEVEKTVRWAVINQSTSRSDPPSRRRRNAVRDYYVDVVALIDKIRFQWFLQQAKQHYDNAMQNIQDHYAIMFSGIDMLYNGINHPNYTVHVRLCKIFVDQKPNASIFIDKYASDGKLKSPQALKALEKIFAGAGRPIVGFYDHVILFTGYDLFKYDKSGNKIYTYAGSTYVGTMCRTDGTSCAVVEDDRGPDILTIAHELGHSLSAKHDGDGNDCSNSDRYIMNNGLNGEQTPETKFNPWQFSACSVKYFTKFLTENPSNSRRYECLAYAIETSANIPDVSNKLLGQFIKPNQQCQLNYGKDSYYCKGAGNIQIEDICHSMYCRDPLKSGICKMMEAYIGTSCDDGKICLYGKCVSVPYAPQVDETCLFGDTKEDHCKSFISKFVGNCYQKAHYELCCGTCNNMSRPIR